MTSRNNRLNFWYFLGSLLALLGAMIVMALGFTILLPEPPPLFSTLERILGMVMLSFVLIFSGGMLVNYRPENNG